MIAVHALAAGKYPRAARLVPAPVNVVRIDPMIVKLAFKLADCPCMIRLRADGTALVVNRCKCVVPLRYQGT